MRKLFPTVFVFAAPAIFSFAFATVVSADDYHHARPVGPGGGHHNGFPHGGGRHGGFPHGGGFPPGGGWRPAPPVVIQPQFPAPPPVVVVQPPRPYFPPRRPPVVVVPAPAPMPSYDPSADVFYAQRFDIVSAAGRLATYAEQLSRLAQYFDAYQTYGLMELRDFESAANQLNLYQVNFQNCGPWERQNGYCNRSVDTELSMVRNLKIQWIQFVNVASTMQLLQTQQGSAVFLQIQAEIRNLVNLYRACHGARSVIPGVTYSQHFDGWF